MPVPRPPAGWHADPLARFDARYHDGADWTEHVVEEGTAATDPLPPEEQRPLSIRRTCPICRSEDIVVVLEPGGELLCLTCGATISFRMVGSITPESRAELEAEDPRRRATLNEIVTKARKKRRR